MSAFKQQLLGGTPALPAVDMKRVQIDPPKPGQPPRLAICVPSFSEVKADFAQAYAGMCAYMVGRCALAMLNEKSSMVSMARNNLAQRALDLGAEWIFFCDSDLVFGPDSIARLMAHNLDIVGATYNKRVPPYETLGKLRGPMRDLSDGGLAEADFMPGGFMLYKADVFRKVPWPWFYETFWTPGEPLEGFIEDLRNNRMSAMPADVEAELRGATATRAWLEEDAKLLPPNRAMSEDYNATKKFRRYGFQVWCDLNITFELRHIGEQQVTCTPPPKPGEIQAPPQTNGRAPATVVI